MAESSLGFSSTVDSTVLAMTYPQTANTSAPAPNIDPVKVEEKNLPYILTLHFESLPAESALDFIGKGMVTSIKNDTVVNLGYC